MPSRSTPIQAGAASFLGLPLQQRLEAMRALASDFAAGGALDAHALDRCAQRISQQLPNAGRSAALVATRPESPSTGVSAFLNLPLPQRLESMRLLASHLAGGGSLADQTLDSVARHSRPRSHPAQVVGLERPAPGPMESDVQVLERYGVLEEAVRQRLVKGLIESVRIDSPDAPAAQGPNLDATLDDPRLKVWIEEHYEPLVQAWLLRYRHDLETWIYVCLRVQDESLASELYLQAIEDGCDLSVLVDSHGTGDERMTRGIVGPIRASRVIPEIRHILEEEPLGQIVAPQHVHGDWLILQQLHRLPADPADGWREDVLREIFQRDLASMVARVIRRLGEEPISLDSAVDSCSWQPGEASWWLDQLRG